MAEDDNEIHFSVGNYVVAYIDLLGQQDKLREIKDIPDPDDENNIANLRKQIRETYGAVHFLRNSFDKFFKAFATSKTDISSLSEAQQEQFRKYVKSKIKFQPFSDSVVVYTPLFGTSVKVPPRGIYGVLGATVSTMITCLAGGHPIRGGIDLGIGMEISGQEMYGPALARAYTLESKLAQYPRVLIGDELIKFLSLHANHLPTGPDEIIAKGVADYCLELCAQDIDGRYFLDFIGPGAKKLLCAGIDGDVIAKAFKNVISFHEKYREERNQTLSIRYSLLRDYFEDRASLWGIEIERDTAN